MSGPRSDPGDAPEPPGHTLDVAPTPVRGSGGGSRRGLAAFAAIVVIILVGVGFAQVGGQGAQPRTEPATARVTAAPATAAAAPTEPAAPPQVAGADAVGILDATPVRMRPPDLALAVHDGSIAGRLVFVEGALEATPVRCRSLTEGWRGCVDLAIRGLGVPVWAGPLAIPWAGDPPAGALMVTVARTGGLVYLGALVPLRGRPPSLSDLDARLEEEGLASSAGIVFETGGFLVRRPMACGEGCVPSTHYLAQNRAVTPGTSGPVEPILEDTPEIDPADAVIEGTFLVARPEGARRWQVVARYVPERSIRVLAP